MAANFGGTRNPLVVSWPARIKAKGEMRSQFQHVIDIAPTVLEAAGLPEPKTVNGIVQTPMEGVSMVYTFDDANAPSRHTTQYFEIFANRAIYHDGWVAATVHKAPWEPTPRRKLAEDIWELYNVDEDFSETNDLAASNPAKLKELQALFMKEAEKYRVLPIDDRSIERFDPAMAGRPDLMAGRKSLDGLFGHDRHDGERLHQREKPIGDDHRRRRDSASSANGVILCQGGRFGGWSLYVMNGKPAYTYNYVGLHQYTVNATERLRQARRPSSSISPTTADAAKAERPPSTSMARRSGPGASSDQRQHLLCRRRRRRGRGRRDQRELGVQAAREQVHRQDREDVGVGVLDASRPDLLAVDVERGRSAFAAAVAVVGEIELDRRLAGRKPLAGVDRVLLKTHKVVGVGRLAVLHVEAPAAEAAALAEDHAVGAAWRESRRRR